MCVMADRRRRPGSTTVGIVGGGPAGLMLSPPAGPRRHRLRRRRRPHPHRRSSRPSGPASSSGTASRLLVDTGVSDRVLREGDRHDGIELALRRRRAPRSTSQDLVGAVGLALPADRRVHRPRRRPRRATAATCGSGSPTPSVVDLTTDRPGLRFTDADGRRPRGPLRLPGRRRRLAQHLPARRFPESERRQLLPGVPVRLVRHPVRGAAERARADLQPLRPRLRADQPAHRDAAADVLPVRPGRGRRRLVRRPDLGRAAGPGRAPTATPCRRGRSPSKTVLPLPQLRLRADAVRPAAAGRRRRAHGAARPAPRASTSPWPTSGCWPRRSSAR